MIDFGLEKFGIVIHVVKTGKIDILTCILILPGSATTCQQDHKY